MSKQRADTETQAATKHTPGPWAVFHDHPDEATARSLALIRPANSKGYHEHDDVASVYCCELTERVANAHLIAAAPELLEALQALRLAREQDKFRSWERGVPKFNEAEALADAAIAKATNDRA